VKFWREEKICKMEVLRYICDLCLAEGKTKNAQKYYVTEKQVFDCCESCVKIVKKAGYEVKDR
jgi:hypothetical protein